MSNVSVAMPVVYVAPASYTSETPAWVPIAILALKAVAVMGIEWTTLDFVEHAPFYLKAATFGFSAVILAVIEKRHWLNFKRRRLFEWSLFGLLAAYLLIVGYAWKTWPTNGRDMAGGSAEPVVINRKLDTIQQQISALSGRSVGTGATSGSMPVTPFVNPLHSDAMKWKITQVLSRSVGGSNGSKCKVTINRYQLPYAEDYSADLKAILYVMGFQYDETFASGTLPHELTIRYVQGGQNNNCAAYLINSLRQATEKDGNGIFLNGTDIPEQNAPEYLKNCPANQGCVEIGIGNEGGPQ